ncbi:MAG TPA: hypothetical protein VM600_05995, partial [Actinomycetota bacterium]|nr:hypothetical protein [Actinomycetota bacterium]
YMVENPAVPGWPMDAQAHPERTIRNGIFGRNAAVPYRVDPDAALQKIKCDDVVTLRNQYYVNQYTSLEAAPRRTNMLNGPRTRQQADKLRLEEGWIP